MRLFPSSQAIPPVLCIIYFFPFPFLFFLFFSLGCWALESELELI